MYAREEETTADHMTGLCVRCHDILTWAVWYVSRGGSPQLLGALLPGFLARLLDRRDQPETQRVGRVLRVRHAWGAVVSGESRPRAAEVVTVHLRCSREWRDVVVVVDVVDGRPGSWRVRTRWLLDRDEVRPICVRDLARQHDLR